MLKSFSYNHQGRKNPHLEGEGIALAVAKTMPGLRHLQLFGYLLRNSSLLAILDGCTHLESLDLRQWFNLRLDGDLGKRCSQQIKCIKYPNDSTDGYKWDTSIPYEDIYDDDLLFPSEPVSRSDCYCSSDYDLDFDSDDDCIMLDHQPMTITKTMILLDKLLGRFW